MNRGGRKGKREKGRGKELYTKKTAQKGIAKNWQGGRKKDGSQKTLRHNGRGGREKGQNDLFRHHGWAERANGRTCCKGGTVTCGPIKRDKANLREKAARGQNKGEKGDIAKIGKEGEARGEKGRSTSKKTTRGGEKRETKTE